PRSQLPALLGLNAARESRMLIDTMRNAIYMVGPGDYDLMQALPPGTQQFNCILAPSGHMMIPCAEFLDPTKSDSVGRGILQLMPQLTLPVEHLETEIEIEGGSGNILPEQQQSEVQPDSRRHRTRAAAYEAPN
ncbi:MAG: hypothetical protein ACKPKO_24635, partial [Candidatus Fonsibacter sp.]